ncbi:MAG: hypothetical protein IKP22_08030 [Clostridia bacterium]|nr:hypothetical protein [Clostridia bacterium]
MAGIWIRLVRKNRIQKDIIVDCGRDEWIRALHLGVEKLDTARPLLLEKHERDWAEFGQTRFLKEHFMEDVAFDRMEVEWIDPEAGKKTNEKYL